MKSLLVITAVLTCWIMFGEVDAQGAGYIERQLLCVLDQAVCDRWGQQIKDALPEIIGRGCQTCDRAQINNIRRIVTFVQSRYPRLWSDIVQRYSPPSQE